jgi:hypothetical protein
MRPYGHFRRSPAYCVNLGEPEPAPDTQAAFDADTERKNLTPELSFALIGMSSQGMARAVAAELRARGTPKPTLAHYQDLAARGFARKRDGGPFHLLTNDGFALVDSKAIELAQANGIHVLCDGGGIYEVRGYCTCGAWSRTRRKGNFTNANLATAFAGHVLAATATKADDAPAAPTSPSIVPEIESVREDAHHG